MAIFRLMSILQGASGDTKDRYVNNLHFIVDDPLDSGDVRTAIAGPVNTFFGIVDGYVDDSVTREDYRLYDLRDPEPREPFYIPPTTQPDSVAAAYPYEVAACLSFYASRNIRRQRGRIFLGPLTTAISTQGPVNDDPVIATPAKEALVVGFITMCDSIKAAGTPGSVRVAVYSPTDGVAREVTDAWMDNAFDTIRARGTAAGSRFTASMEV